MVSTSIIDSLTPLPPGLGGSWGVSWGGILRRGVVLGHLGGFFQVSWGGASWAILSSVLRASWDISGDLAVYPGASYSLLSGILGKSWGILGAY